MRLRTWKSALLVAALGCVAACGDDGGDGPAGADSGVTDASGGDTGSADADGADAREDAAFEPDATQDADPDTGDEDTGEPDVAADVEPDVAADVEPDVPVEPAPTVTLPSALGLVPDSIVRDHSCSVRAVPEGGDATDWLPTLAESGCYTNAEGGPVPVDAALEYFVRSPLWSDFAGKGRYLYLPPDGTISWSATRAFGLPEGTVILKEFWLDDMLVESRFLELDDGDWVAATYEWNEDHTDATLVGVGRNLSVGDNSWFLPGPQDCMLCHTRASGIVLGLRGDQMFLDADMFGLGDVNQMAAYSELGLFDEPLPETIELLPLARLNDEEETVEHRVRSYLESNCANCHQPGGAPHSDIDLRITTALADSRACDVYPTSGDLGLRGAARIISPGAPENSILTLRMDRRDDEQMPQLSTFIVHDQAVELVEQWILELEGCE